MRSTLRSESPHRSAPADLPKGGRLAALEAPTMSFQTCFPWAFDAPRPRATVAVYRCRNGRMARAAR